MAVSEDKGNRLEEDTPTSNDTLLTSNGAKGKGGAEKKVRLNKKGEVVCTVTMLDGHDVEVEIAKSATGQELVDKVCSHLQLLEKDWFSCLYKINADKYWLNHERKIGKQLGNAAWDFHFQVKFYPSEPTIMTEDLTRYQLFLQVRTDVYSGKLPCSFVTYSLLGSYAAQSEFGDYDPSELGTGIQYLKDAAPYSPHQNEELLERIQDLHRNHSNLNPADAEMSYLDNAKVLSLYGVDLHRARDEDFSDVMVGVCSYGLNVYKERLRMHRFPWAKILKISYKRNSFYVKSRPSNNVKNNPSTLTYKFPNHKAAKKVWKSAVEHHAFFRLKEPEPPRKGMFPLFGSRFRYSGRTEHQTRNAFQNLDRKTPTIDRAASRRYAAGANRAYPQSTGMGEGTTFSTDRVEEVMVAGGGGHTATLDIKSVRKNRSIATPTAEVDRSFNQTNQDGTMKMGEGGDFSSVSYSKQQQGINNNMDYGDMRYDQYGNPIPNGVNALFGDQASAQEDRQITSHGNDFNDQYAGGGGGVTSSSTVHTTRTYTNTDGTMVTESEKEVKTTNGGLVDHDKAFRDAIFSVIDVNQDLSVQKIEIQAEK